MAGKYDGLAGLPLEEQVLELAASLSKDAGYFAARAQAYFHQVRGRPRGRATPPDLLAAEMRRSLAYLLGHLIMAARYLEADLLQEYVTWSEESGVTLPEAPYGPLPGMPPYPPAGPAMKLTEVALFTAQVDKVTAFYRGLLRVDPTVEPGHKAEFRLGDLTVLVHERYEAGPGELPDQDHLAFAVPDVDQACAELAARGYEIAHGPASYHWGRSAYLRDPDGRMLELHQEK
jgi:catechol 2,3-dioxygenase-like lactoylglutathione lyase family enzyme